MKKGNSIVKLKKSITFRYAIALSLIAMLSTAAFFALHFALEGSDSTAYIVNISGKQRMLSQHIMLDVYRIYESHMAQDLFQHERAKQLLQKNTEEMLVANEILSTGQLPNGKTIELSPVLYQMYFGKMNIAQRVEKYIGLSRRMIDDPTVTQASGILKELDDRSERLLFDLNKLVQQYEVEGQAKLTRMKQMETGVWLLTLFALILEVVFIFQPMVEHIVALSEAEERALENLQNQVKIRTLHLQQANQKLEAMASHDPLTGLKNRLNLETDIEQIINQHALNQAPYAVLMLDIDWFKEVNDSYGHDAGDLVLVEVAQILRKGVREGDKIYRAGGEEFVILLNRISFQDAVNRAEKIRRMVQNHTFEQDNFRLNKSISGGLYHSSIIKSDKVRAILKMVDNALYQSKAMGRNRITIVDQLFNQDGITETI